MSSFLFTLLVSSLVILLLGGLGIIVSRSHNQPQQQESAPLGRPRLAEILWTLTFALGVLAALVSHIGN